VKVFIKDLSVEMEVKNNGVEFDVASPGGDHLGDLYVTKSGLTWCKGKTNRENGQKMTWDKFMAMMEE
jgi:hypothetical protein